MDIQHNLLTAAYRFEKSLYDLIRGLRNHRGTERAYIQDSLRECRTEIKSQDMGPSTDSNISKSACSGDDI